MTSFLLAFAAIIFVVSASGTTDGYKGIKTPTGYTSILKHGNSSVWTVDAEGAYVHPIYIVNLYGDHYTMGYDYGYMLADKIQEMFPSFIKHFLPYSWEQFVLEEFLDWQWDSYLSKQVPKEYFEELKGVKDGAEARGFYNIEKYIQRIYVISNFPGDIESNIEWLLFHEGVDAFPFSLQEHLRKRNVGDSSIFGGLPSMSCSHFAVWGSRTKDRKLYSMRNLDWAPDTGANKYKSVTVFHPTDGIPHAAIGFFGMLGALTGMSAQGITVAESGNDVRQETFEGFPWVLRLRYIMENANTLDKAVGLWSATNNTLGMNHMIASSNDAKPNGKPAVALETMARYSALFYENDPREANYMYTNKDGTKVHLGNPLPEAVWRTNHGYDPTIVAAEIAPTAPGHDSEVRYNIAHNSFAYYESAGIEMTHLEAINVTSIMADKGGMHFYKCEDKAEGINIISVTFAPEANAGTMYLAYESGSGSTWRPGCCGWYIALDMSRWW